MFIPGLYVIKCIDVWCTWTLVCRRGRETVVDVKLTAVGGTVVIGADVVGIVIVFERC